MPYINPKTVVAPKHRVRDVRIVFDAGEVEKSWSVAELKWNEEEVFGVRWNGDSGSQKGTPVAHGNPTWFILPNEIAEAVRNMVERLKENREATLLEGYRQMAADSEREAEADEWTEGLIGDAY